MIRIADQPPSVPAWHAGFLALLPSIIRQASRAFRHCKPEAREDAVVEVAANACAAYFRLFERGKADIAYATPLAQYGIRQVRDFRKVGSQLRVRDVLSEYAQKHKGFKVGRLDRYDAEERAWREIVVEDRHATPADVATTRIDFADWLRTMPLRYRRIAEVLAVGERTQDVARRFRLSPGRISQLRQEYYKCWQRFQGEKGITEEPTATTAAV
jgi:hypothetical protein